MMYFKTSTGISVVALMAAFCADAYAQNANNMCFNPATATWQPCGPSNPMYTQPTTGGAAASTVNQGASGSQAWPVTAGASQNSIGNVGGNTKNVCVTPTVTSGNAYGANVVVGGLLTFSNIFTSTGNGIIQGVTVNIKDNETGGFTFYTFSANPSNTTWTDAASAAINSADVFKVRTPVLLTSNTQLASAGFSIYYSYGLGAATAPASSTVFGVLVSNAVLSTNFAATGDVQVCLHTLADS